MKIKDYLSCLPVWLFLIPYFSYGAELTISVQFPDKTPGVGIKVQQVQLARYGIHNKLLGVTDENGQIKFQFQDKRNTESRFGYGVHRFVIMTEKYSWDVSDLFYWNLDSKDKEELRLKGIPAYDYYKQVMSRSKSNWSIGKLIKVRKDDLLEWKVILDKGRNVEVKVIDQFKEPVRNRIFSVSLNLEALSHTGRGGGIPMFKIQTDKRGRVNLSNVGDFFYSFDNGGRHPKFKDQYIYCAPNAYFWTGIVKAFLKRKQEEVVYHKCIPQNATFVVTDKKTGEIITNAQILGVTLFSTQRQGGPLGYTDVNGCGEYICRKFYTKHLVQFGVAKEGYKTYLLDVKEFVSGKIFEIALESQPEKTRSLNGKEFQPVGILNGKENR